MKLLDEVDNIVLNDNNKYYLEDIENMYFDYINILKQLDHKLLKEYLEIIKSNEILYNQQSEEESSLLISIYMNLSKYNSIDKMIELMGNSKDIHKDDVLGLHKILMEGTTDSDVTEGFRKNNDRFVGAFNIDGTKRIDYMPIDYNDIEDVMKKIIDLINNKDDNIFMNSFIVHALISVAQPFYDGNTRLSRLIQHGKIWTNTNRLCNVGFSNPVMYLSRNYFLSRGQYRSLLKDLALNENNEMWNNWFKYNLNMVSEQLYYLDTNVKKLIKKR